MFAWRLEIYYCLDFRATKNGKQFFSSNFVTYVNNFGSRDNSRLENSPATIELHIPQPILQNYIAIIHVLQISQENIAKGFRFWGWGMH